MQTMRFTLNVNKEIFEISLFALKMAFLIEFNNFCKVGTFFAKRGANKIEGEQNTQ